MELRIKSYSHEGKNIIFECAYGGREFNAEVNPRVGFFRQDEYDASHKERERIGEILRNKAEKIIGSN